MMISLESYGSALLFLAASFLICTICFGNNSAPGKKRRSNFVVALVIIGFIGALKVFYDSSLLSVNNYSVLQVPRHCSTLDIRKAYKRLSKEHHPDKSVDPGSLVFYQKVKNAYDVLMDETARDVYNRFGDVDMSAKVIPDPRKDELQLIADIALVYLFWIVLVFVATSPVSSQSCRTWIAIIGVICMVVESTLKLTDTTVPESYLPQYLTEYELVCYIHCTFPVVVALLKCVSESLYVDVNTTTIAVLEETIKAQKEMDSLLAELNQLILLVGTDGDRKKSSKQDHQDTSAQIESVGGKIAEIRGRIEQANERTAVSVAVLKQSSANPGSSYYWIIFIAMYAGIYFLN